jgi:hypothetical protein
LTKRRNALVVGVAALCLSIVPAASAHHSRPHFTGHERTATVSCSGGSFFIVDANALFGQETETAHFNAAPPPDTCGVTLNP